MADSKITALTALTAADPANDMLPIVDVSDNLITATGTTKRISINNILACSPSATLASATITGDLTVDTNVLKVDTTNNRVGIGTASPANVLTVRASDTFVLSTGGSTGFTGYSAQVDSGAGTSLGAFANSFGWVGTSTNHYLEIRANNIAQQKIEPLGVFSWYDGAGGTRMTLNSTGLGVGVTPTALSGFGTTFRQKGVGAAGGIFTENNTGVSWFGAYSGTSLADSAALIYPSGGTLRFATSTSVGVGGFAPQMTLDAAGNLGLAVTPSAWQVTYKAIDINAVTSIWGSSSISIVSNNTWYDGSLRYKTAATASYLQQGSKRFEFWQSSDATPVAGGVATFTQAMTLDASGNLLVGTTGLNATWNTRLTLSSDSGTTRWAVGPYSTATNFVISGASGGGVYLNGTAATSWTSASDERLKDIIEPIGNAVAKVGSLRAVIGKFKNDALNTRKSFLIAQDVQSVLPEAVDASNPDRLGLAYTDVIPLLVAAIKELTARVQTLEAK
jgi:hypothetical protein